jgi:hypothetical protein
VVTDAGDAGTGNRVVSQAEYARHRGVTKQAVSAMVRKGRLAPPAVTPEGMIDISEADLMLDAPVERGSNLATESAKLQKAKRELAEMEVAERRRQLVPAAVLRDAGGTLGALVRERLAARRTDIIAAVQAAYDPDRALARLDDLLCRDLAAALEEALAA